MSKLTRQILLPRSSRIISERNKHKVDTNGPQYLAVLSKETIDPIYETK